MNYTIIEFQNANDEFIKVDDLKKFISDAEIIISDYEDAWHKDFIKEVSEKHRGAALDFQNGMFTWGYNVKAKLVKAGNCLQRARLCSRCRKTSAKLSNDYKR